VVVFESALAKVGRAHHHLEELTQLTSNWLAGKPLRLSRDVQEESTSFRVSIVDPIPADLPLILGDFVHNLRSALDHVVYEAVKRSDENRCGFQAWNPKNRRPFDVKAYKALVEENAPSASAAPLRKLLELRPHEGGADEYLWCLHRLDIIDKHRLVIAVCGATEKVQVKLWGDAYVVSATTLDALAERIPNAASLTVDYQPVHPCPLAEGTVLFDHPTAQSDQVERVDWHYHLALAEPRPYAGEPLLDTLEGLMEQVEALIVSFRAQLDG